MSQIEKRPYEIYSFSDKIRVQLAPLYKLNNYMAVNMILEDFIIVFVSINSSIYLYKHCSIYLAILGYLASISIIGCRMRGISELLHEASHNTLAANQKLN